MKRLKQKSNEGIERIAIRATRWVGSTNSLITHTIIFIICAILALLGINFQEILLVLTTVVSLEAIYLSIFIQMSVNRQGRRLREVSKDIDEIQKDVEEIQEDVEGIEKDVDEIQEDIDEIQEDVEEIENDAAEEEIEEQNTDKALLRVENTLSNLISQIEELRKHHDSKS